MEIKLTQVKVRDLVKGYVNNDEEGVIGFDGKLNIRPPYQREFVYDRKKEVAVIDTVMKGFPLNVMYWADNEDGTFEVIDGQQRTISICEYVKGNFSIPIYENVNGKYSSVNTEFHNLTDEEQDKILNYDLMIYRCSGNNDERLKWFETINIAGVKLNNQELLNATHVGLWLADAKKKFSKTNCAAYQFGKKFVEGSPIRQEYLETALDWISDGNIKKYMDEHQHDTNANELWLYFKSVIDWVRTIFGVDEEVKPKNYRKEMQRVPWGKLYNKYKDNPYDAAYLEKRVNELMANEEVTNKKGVYEYLLSGESEEAASELSARIFSERDKRTAYERQNGICPIDGEWHKFEDMEADHIVPWWKGGFTTIDNLQMISKTANKRKGGKSAC